MSSTTFGKRFLAYLIDIIIIAVVGSFIVSFMPAQKVDTKAANKIVKEYKDKKITAKEYTKKVSKYTHKVEKVKFPSYIISFTLTFIYFCLLQYKLKGQTLGKRFMKIKVVTEEDKDVGVNSLIIRSLIINELAFNMLNMVSIYLFNDTMFTYTNSILTILNVTLLIICAFMVALKKEKRGIHDYLGKTKVVDIAS